MLLLGWDGLSCNRGTTQSANWGWFETLDDGFMREIFLTL